MSSDVSSVVEEFFSKFRLRKYTKGQILILNGDKVNNIYYVVSGRVKQYDVTSSGDEIILNLFKKPSFFPMWLAVNKSASSYIFEAETDVELRQAPAEDVIAFLQANPDVTYDLLSRVYRGLDGLMGRMVQLMSSSARSRLIYELIIEARRFGELKKDGSYSLDIKEADLGSRAGLSRETVSREISKLKASGLIEIKNKGILIKDLSKLEKHLIK